MLVGARRRGSRVHGVVLAPGGRRVEVRIVIHPSHGKRPSADSGGEGGRGGRAGGGRSGDRARGRLRATGSARGGASRKEAGLEPSGGACLCPRISAAANLLHSFAEETRRAPVPAGARRWQGEDAADRKSAPRFHRNVNFRALRCTASRIDNSRLQGQLQTEFKAPGGSRPDRWQMIGQIPVGCPRIAICQAFEHSTVIGKSEISTRSPPTQTLLPAHPPPP